MSAGVSIAPLVEPGPELSREELARYARHLTLAEVGPAGQRRIRAARVLVVGAGGLGSPALQYLAAAGVGTVGIVDDDVVETANLQRQVVHRSADVGRSKVESAARAVRGLNPFVDVVEHPVRLSRDNALEIVSGYDLVLDGADNFATRYVVSDACALAGLPCVWGSILRFEGRVSLFWAQLPDGSRGPTYRDLHPEAPPAGEVPSCAEGGVLGMLPGVIGSVMVAEAVKLITGTGVPLLGRVLLHDSLAMTWREIGVIADPAAEPVRTVGGTPATADETPCGAGASADVIGAGANGGSVTGAPAVLPPQETVTAVELAAMLERRDAGETSFGLVDVREDWERQLVSIPGSVAVPLTAIEGDGARALPEELRGRTLVLHCKAGSRSARALEALRPAWADREERLAHLDGGILAWGRDVDPEAPAY